MCYRYFHDQAQSTVYKYKSPPTVTEKLDRSNNRTDWIVTGEIETTRADNILRQPSNQWMYPVRTKPQEQYDSRDDERLVVEFFDTQHQPNYPEIDETTYENLRAKYEQIAKQNRD